MVFEFIGVFSGVINTFLRSHISLISYALAAVFLVLSETTINYRIIAPLLSWMEGMFFSSVPVLPNILSTAVFIIWATISIVVYEFVVEFFLRRYQAHIGLILLVAYIGIMMAVNQRYRD